MWKGSEEYYRSGPWNGLRFSGAPDLRPNPVFKFNFISNENKAYYEYHALDKSVISRMVMNQTNYSRQRFIWIEANSTWSLYASVPREIVTVTTFVVLMEIVSLVIHQSISEEEVVVVPFGEAKDEQKTRVIVIVIVAVAAAIISGMLLIAYLICKRGKKFRGNVTFYDL
nr:g-type lectin s-receptor-like serine/threonine-protein kinase [Quercus suber]